MAVKQEEIDLARSLLKKHKNLNALTLMRHFKVTHAHAQKIIEAVVKEVFSKKKAQKQGMRKMSTYEIKAIERFAEVDIASKLLNFIERSQRQGLGCKEQLDNLIFELQSIAKKPIIPMAHLEED